MGFSIEEFWAKRFDGVSRQPQAMPVAGWNFNVQSDAAFVQAGLKLREHYDDLTQPVWLVGAPGAVGKSTFAKELCAATGAIYLDLASAATVAGNYVIGGLVYANVLSEWQQGKTALVIDALDEARLRVTQSGFEDFLLDLANAAQKGKFPLVVMGRVGIIEEALIVLEERAGVHAPIFDIEFFDEDQANRFVMARLQKAAQDAVQGSPYWPLRGSLAAHGSVYESVVSDAVKALQQISAQDERRFVGYAPVLDAVAKVIATETNVSSLRQEIQRILEGEVLSSLSTEILKREQSKLLTQLQAVTSAVPQGLYDAKEQLERLAAHIFRVTPPPVPAHLAMHQVGAYQQAVDALLNQHPFLDGNGTAPAGAVFAAAIICAGLQNERDEIRRAAENFASSSQHTPNPFLFEFYREKQSLSHLKTEHVGLVFESILAHAKPGQVVRLDIDGDEEGIDLAGEITVTHDAEMLMRIEFSASSTGTLRLGRRVSGVNIDVQATSVELGAGDQLELVAPVFIASKSLLLDCSQLVVKADMALDETTIILESEETIVDEPSLMAPVVRQGAQLQVSWPGASAYPWNSFSAPPSVDESPKTAEALRALRRLVMAFRSHSKGSLRRFKDKIEHQRMLKGEVGEQLLRKLLHDRVITLDNPMYVLDPIALGAKVGASYVSVKMKAYTDETRQYVQSVLA